MNRLFNVPQFTVPFFHLSYGKIKRPQKQRVSVSCINSERGQKTFSRDTGHKPVRWCKDKRSSSVRCYFEFWWFL